MSRIEQPQLLGPEGARRRMEEIRSRLASVSGPKFEDVIGQATGATANVVPFGSPGGMSGNIGTFQPGSFQPGGFAPLQPFGPGVSVNGMSAPGNLRELIAQAARDAGVDENLFDALVAAESGYNPAARSGAGAMGLTQLMPGTAKSLGVTDPFDPAQNLKGGAKYLAQMLVKFGDIRVALAAYNAGPGAVERAGGIPNYAETKAYVEKVMNLYTERAGR